MNLPPLLDRLTAHELYRRHQKRARRQRGRLALRTAPLLRMADILGW